MLHIVTVNAGDYLGRGVEYTNILYNSVRRNLPDGMKGEFVVFTDDGFRDYSEGVVVRPLPAPWLKSWWHKLSLFDQSLFPAGDRVLYIDLDTLITGPLDDIAAYAGEFAILRDFYRPKSLQSSVMAWEAGTNADIWGLYGLAGFPQDDPFGDQAFIEKVVERYDLWQDILKGQFVSFKVEARFGIPKNARLVVFHGEPRPHEVTKGWVPHVWKIDGGTTAEFALATNVSHEIIANNIRDSKRLTATNKLKMAEPHDGVALVCAGGPSLSHDLGSVKAHQAGGARLYTVNGTLKYLESHGIASDAHVIVDAREENIQFVPLLEHPCERLFASQCAPSVLKAAGQNLTLWHPYFDGVLEITGEGDGAAYVGGGSTAGLKAVCIAYCQGYRKIHLYGFDSSYDGIDNHAYPQSLNEKDRIIDVALPDGKAFKAAPWMVTQAEDFQDLAGELTALGCELYVHGTGLLPEMASQAQPSTEPPELRAKEILSRLEGIPEPKVAEIGVFTADLSRRLLGRRPDLKLFMVDSWGKNQSSTFKDSCDFHAALTNDEQEDCYKLAKAFTAFAGDRATIMRSLSTEAAREIPNHFLDMVFIDADHSYEGCTDDLNAWYDKVKPGGIVSGHDYANNNFKFGPMVKQAVDEFIAERGLDLDLGENYTWFAVKPKEATA